MIAMNRALISEILAAASDEFEVHENEIDLMFDDGDVIVTIEADDDFDEVQCIAVFEDGQWEFEEL